MSSHILCAHPSSRYSWKMSCLRLALLLGMALLSLNSMSQVKETAVTGADSSEITARHVELKTDLGTILIELFPDKAPATVANFLRYCNDGFYVGTIFHRVIPGFVVQGGGMTFDFVKKETHDPVVNESNNGLKNRRGTLSMARLPDPDSATSQFFINLNRNRHLDPQKDQPGYTVFARVIEGMDVVDKMTEEPQGKYRAQAPDLPIRILAVTVKP